MSDNKKVVEKYMEGFNDSDHEKVLSCLTEDVVWVMPGFFHLNGKEAFDKEIENDAFEGKPIISVIRMVEEDTIVEAEGSVKSRMKNGELLDAVFCDVFHFREGKIKQLTTYLMQQSK